MFAVAFRSALNVTELGTAGWYFTNPQHLKIINCNRSLLQKFSSKRHTEFHGKHYYVQHVDVHPRWGMTICLSTKM